MQERFMANRFENEKFIVEYYPEETIVEFFVKDVEFEIEDVIEMHSVTLGFTQTRNYATLFRAMDFFSLSNEARVEGSKRHYSAFVIVQAFVVKNLAQRLVANFVMRFNKPVRETGLFSTAEDARKWLNTKVAAHHTAQGEKMEALHQVE